jgi:hypothetical protein
LLNPKQQNEHPSNPHSHPFKQIDQVRKQQKHTARVSSATVQQTFFVSRSIVSATTGISSKGVCIGSGTGVDSGSDFSMAKIYRIRILLFYNEYTMETLDFLDNEGEDTSESTTEYSQIVEETHPITIHTADPPPTLTIDIENETLNKRGLGVLNFYETYRSNSPISLSYSGSPENSFHGSDNDNDLSDSDFNDDPLVQEYNRFLHRQETSTEKKGAFKKLGYRDTVQMIDKYYEHTLENRFSNEIDILTTYLKGQKHLYIQAKQFTQWKLNCLMFPTLTLTAFITIISPFIECNTWSTAFISSVNAIIALFIATINYLKLESHIEIYLQRANHFDKLETSLEFANNKLSFLHQEKDKTKLVLLKIKEVEKKVSEMKDTSIVFLPDEVKLLFPIICNINIFAFIKKMELHKKKLVLKFKDIKNEIRFLHYKLDSHVITGSKCSMDMENGIDKNMGESTVDLSIDEFRQRNRLTFLYKMKEKMKEDIFSYMSAYSQIDELFSKEIKKADMKKRGWGFCFLCFWKPTSSLEEEDLQHLNPVLHKYFQFIFADG